MSGMYTQLHVLRPLYPQSGAGKKVGEQEGGKGGGGGEEREKGMEGRQEEGRVRVESRVAGRRGREGGEGRDPGRD